MSQGEWTSADSGGDQTLVDCLNSWALGVRQTEYHSPADGDLDGKVVSQVLAVMKGAEVVQEPELDQPGPGAARLEVELELRHSGELHLGAEQEGGVPPDSGDAPEVECVTVAHALRIAAPAA